MLAIIEPAEDRSLLSIEQLRKVAGVEDASRDAELSRLGLMVADLMAGACGLEGSTTAPATFKVERVREVLDTAGIAALALARRPVVSLHDSEDSHGFLIDTELDANAGLLYRLDSCDRRVPWVGRVLIEYSSGFDEVPSTLQLAAEMTVKSLLDRKDRDLTLKVEDVPGVIRREWWVQPLESSVIPDEVIDLLYQGGFVH